MKRASRVTLSLSKGLLVLTLAACQGSFGSGGTEAPGGMAPPVNPQSAQQNPVNPSAMPSTSPMVGMNVTPGPGGFASYAFADAPKSGLQCPEDQGFSCNLRFNVTGKTGSPHHQRRLRLRQVRRTARTSGWDRRLMHPLPMRQRHRVRAHRPVQARHRMQVHRLPHRFRT